MSITIPIFYMSTRVILSGYRSHTVGVEYTTRTGKKITKTYTDFVARIFQHEYDHLEGLVFLDRLESMKDVVMEKEYQRLLKKF